MVFTDVVLTDGTGLELLDELLPQKPEMAVLTASGYASHKSQLDKIKQRGYGFIGKPYTSKDLLNAIDQSLERSGAR